jgi:hypothetical protein
MMSKVLEILNLTENILVHNTTGPGLEGILRDKKLRAQAPARMIMGIPIGKDPPEGPTPEHAGVSFSQHPYYSHLSRHGPSIMFDGDKISQKTKLQPPLYKNKAPRYFGWNPNDRTTSSYLRQHKTKIGYAEPTKYKNQGELRHLGSDVPIEKDDIKGIMYHWNPDHAGKGFDKDTKKTLCGNLEDDFVKSHNVAKDHNIPFHVAVPKHSHVSDVHAMAKRHGIDLTGRTAVVAGVG